MAVEHAEDPLEPRAGVDAGLRERDLCAIGLLIELHEDEVPELEETLFAAVSRTAAVAELRPSIEEDLRARSVGAGVGHAPPVVVVEALDAIGRHPDAVAPDVGCVVIGEVDRDPQTLGVEAEHVGDQLPHVGDGLLLEVVAEAEVAQHLEEGEVSRRATHLVEIIVLAAGPDHLLDADGTRVRRRLLTQEVRLERHHPGVGEQQGGVMGNEAGRRHHGVIASDEEVGEGAAELVGFHQQRCSTRIMAGQA